MGRARDVIDRVDTPVTDNLRDRITVALRGHGPMGAYYRDGLEFCSCGAETDGLLEFEAHLADAVIRELELKEERADKQRPMHACATPGLYYRYVTKWTTDE